MQHEQRRRYEDQWHLDKRLNVGHIITTIALVGAMMGIWADMDKRVTRLEVQQEESKRVAEDIKRELREINRKMDRLIERLLDGASASHGVR